MFLVGNTLLFMLAVPWGLVTGGQALYLVGALKKPWIGACFSR